VSATTDSRPEPCVTLTDAFLESASELEHTDARRVSAFLGKVLVEPTASGLRPEIVKDAHDRTIRSYRVTRELRAVAQIQGRDVTFLFVGTHEKAYSWAKKHCVECQAGSHGVRLVGAEDSARTLRAWECLDHDQLCDVLDSHGVAHELR
jgi:hypothetical protein